MTGGVFQGAPSLDGPWQELAKITATPTVMAWVLHKVYRY